MKYLRGRDGSVCCFEKVDKEQYTALSGMLDRGPTQLEKAVAAGFA